MCTCIFEIGSGSNSYNDKNKEKRITKKYLRDKTWNSGDNKNNLVHELYLDWVIARGCDNLVLTGGPRRKEKKGLLSLCRTSEAAGDTLGLAAGCDTLDEMTKISDCKEGILFRRRVSPYSNCKKTKLTMQKNP